MDIAKFINRKYPNSKEKIKNVFNSELLLKLQKGKYKIGILDKDILNDEKYKKGTMFMYKRTKEYYGEETSGDGGTWNGGFQIYCIFKCRKGYTCSGYHGFVENNNLKFTEITS